MKTIHVIIFLVGFVYTPILANKIPIKWGNVSKEELQLKGYDKDLQAPAVVLCDYGTAEVGPRTEYIRHVRVKVFKNAGVSYGTIEIPYKSYDRYEVILQMNAQTFNLNDKGEIVKTKLYPKDFKEEIIDNRHKKIVFTLPNVKPGSVFEYRYTIRSLDLARLQNWYFQSTIPTLLSDYSISVPRRFTYLITFQKGDALNLEEQKVFANRIQWLYATNLKKAAHELSSNNYLLYGSQTGNVKVYLSYGERLHFVMRDVPGLKPKPEMFAFTDYYPAVKAHLYYADRNYGIPFYYRTIYYSARTNYELWNRNQLYSDRQIGYVLYWLPTWDEFNKKCQEDEHLGKSMVKVFNYQSLLDSTINQNNSDLKSVETIFQTVKSNIEWNGIYSMYASNNLDKVIKRKLGNSGEINILFISLLRKAGFDVNPVLIRTKNLGRIENMYPVNEQFNHIIAQVVVNGLTYYVDACNGSGSLTKLPRIVEDTEGWIIKKEGFGWVDVTNQEPVSSSLQANL